MKSPHRPPDTHPERVEPTSDQVAEWAKAPSNTASAHFNDPKTEAAIRIYTRHKPYRLEAHPEPECFMCCAPWPCPDYLDALIAADTPVIRGTKVD